MDFLYHILLRRFRRDFNVIYLEIENASCYIKARILPKAL